MLCFVRMVNTCLAEELKEIHAFEQKTLTPEQWEKQKSQWHTHIYHDPHISTQFLLWNRPYTSLIARTQTCTVFHFCNVDTNAIKHLDAVFLSLLVYFLYSNNLSTTSTCRLEGPGNRTSDFQISGQSALLTEPKSPTVPQMSQMSTLLWHWRKSPNFIATNI